MCTHILEGHAGPLTSICAINANSKIFETFPGILRVDRVILS